VALKYAVYNALYTAGFAAPFTIVFMVGHGVTYTDLALGTSAMAVVMIVAEVPSGYVGDRFGRRNAVLVGQLLFAIGSTGYLFVRSTATVVALYVTFGLAAAIRSGSDVAWFYDALDEHGVADKYTAHASRIGSAVRATTAMTMLAGAGLFLIDPTLAILVAAVANWLCIAVVATFPTRASASDSSALGVREAGRIARGFVLDAPVRTLVAVGAIYTAGMYASSLYIQPTTLTVLPAGGLALGEVRLPSPVVLSGVYAGFTLASAVAVRYGDAAATRFGVGGTAVLAYGLGAVCMLVPLLVPALALPAMIAFIAFPRVAGPSVSSYLNEHTESLARATVMSALSFIRSVVRVPILLGAGVVADTTAPPVAMAALGATVIVVGTILVALDRPLTVDSRVDRVAVE
jgi:MFS family permease